MITEMFEQNGVKTTLIDLSDKLRNQTSPFEPNPHKIKYFDHKESIQVTEKFLGLNESFWPDGEAWAVEEITLSTHSSTHVDAPYHYGSQSNGQPAKTIDQIPLRWCYGDGVLLDFTHKHSGEGITDQDLQEELDRIGYELKPYDIVLIHTGASKYFDEPGYDFKHAGLVASATEWLTDQGIKLIGIDAWGLDRPFDVTSQEAKEGITQFWEAHLVGRNKEYCQIEKLCNLEQMPQPFGFKISAFPINIENASAGWSRVVAIFEEDL
ncbi:cyclase family protein [Hazenella coriacea]|uniref:Kynurenine formamidase n=1 Tax=Hazenella coriacea TaxID=1179467 RepID=A0A4V2UUY2_9BACL|nr:cyclase family protein [Hazenella coriacea]TCS93587.1 kynurenine formamidase [Hazenella coriacea]